MRRVGRIRSGGQLRYALVGDDHFEFLRGNDLCALERTGSTVPRDDALLAAPVAPGKIMAIGLNYRAHAEEMKKPLPAEPLVFMKPSTAVIGPGEHVRLPPESAEVHHEAELAAIVGRRAWRVSPRAARACVFGWACLNDVTARDLQRREVQYTRAKSCDTFAPIGPWIAADVDLGDREVLCRVNGEVRQRGRTGDMVFDPYALISYISQTTTLLPGDVVATGTPPGVGALRAGDRVEVEIEGIGVLANPVMSGIEPERRRRVFFGLGSNLGDREENLCRALDALAAEEGLKVVQRSSLYDTAPVGFAQPRFLNAAVEIETTLPLLELLCRMKVLEAGLGREHRERWGPREIDIDLLLADEVVDLPDLAVPHPRLHERAFALAPVVELAPESVHPLLRKPLRELLCGLSSQDARRVSPSGRWDEVARRAPGTGAGLPQPEP